MSAQIENALAAAGGAAIIAAPFVIWFLRG